MTSVRRQRFWDTWGGFRRESSCSRLRLSCVPDGSVGRGRCLRRGENGPWFQGVAAATPELQNVMRRSSAEVQGLSLTLRASIRFNSPEIHYVPEPSSDALRLCAIAMLAALIGLRRHSDRKRARRSQR